MPASKKGSFIRPVIGIIPLYDDDKESYWMLPGYMKVLELCGAAPIMLPLTTDQKELTELLSLCSGLLLTGGHDVDPAIYHAVPSEKCGSPCRARDEMEGFLLDKALEVKLPVFGICRGIQFMNAHLGGTLYQDLDTEHPSAIEHHMKPPYDRTAHDVEILPGTHLADILGAGIHGVNSYHHQAVKDPAPSVNVMAVSEDGLIEAIEVKGQPFAIGVQWHPEFSYRVNPESVKLVQSFVDACAAFSIR